MPESSKKREYVTRGAERFFNLAYWFLDAGEPLLTKLYLANWPPEVEGLMYGIGAQAIRRFEATLVLCQTGFDDSAIIVLRSLFETVLAERFVLGKYRRSDGCTAQTRGMLAKLPKMPFGKRGMILRSRLYHLWPAIKIDQINKAMADVKHLRRASRSRYAKDMANAAANAKAKLPPAWVLAQKSSQTYSGLSVAALADRCGLQNVHRGAYGLHSLQVHSNDALEYVEFNPGPAHLFWC